MSKAYGHPSSRHFRKPHVLHCTLLEGGRYPRHRIRKDLEEEQMQRERRAVIGLIKPSGASGLLGAIRRLWTPSGSR